MAVLCPLCFRDSSDTCCSEAAADRAAFAQIQRERRALLDRLGIESAQNPRHGGHSRAPTEWETHPNLDSLFAFLAELPFAPPSQPARVISEVMGFGPISLSPALPPSPSPE